MASSVARIPMASFKDRLPGPCVVFSCTGGGSGGFGGVEGPVDVGTRLSPPASPCSSCSDVRQQSRILDRWAAHQARDMVTTVERQAHEAELSALSAASEPVSARAATFLLREMASPPSPSPSGSSSGGRRGVNDLPPNVRASSLIQLWRGLEADAGIVPSPRSASGGGNSVLGSAGGGFSFAEEACGSSEACDESEWEPGMMGQSKDRCGVADGEGKRVGSAEKRLCSGSESQSSSACNAQENAPFSLERSLLYRENADSMLLRAARRLRGWRKIDGLLERMKRERQEELDRLVECHHVSRFSHRNRIQSLLRFRGQHRLLMIRHQELPDSTALELDSLRQRGSTIWFLRERFSAIGQQGNHMGKTADDEDIHVLLRDNSLGLKCTIVADQLTSASPRDQEVAAANDSQTLVEENLSQTMNGDLQEDNLTSAIAWQENSVQISNIDWQSAIDSTNLGNWEGDLFTEESDFDSQNTVEDANDGWPTDASHSHIQWQNHRQAIYREQNGNYPDNMEIQELLRRKPVSGSLASNFREIMDELVLSFVKRQAMVQSIDEEEVLPVQSLDDEFIYANQAPSSFSVMPLSCRTFRSPDSHQGSCVTDQSSHHFLETELVHDLRTDVAEIHHEVGELRKMIETCLDGQSKLQNFIRDQVSSMVYNTVGIAFMLHSSKWEPTKKGNCCVCHEMHVDSLLYRCGHMCTCYKCAQELQQGTGRCPICRAPIVDVVRAYSET